MKTTLKIVIICSISTILLLSCSPKAKKNDSQTKNVITDTIKASVAKKDTTMVGVKSDMKEEIKKVKKETKKIGKDIKKKLD